MTSPTERRTGTWVARLETDEQAAHRIAALFAESFAAEAVAVNLVDNGRGRWQVAIHFRLTPDEQTVRRLAADAAGPAAAKALTFERFAAKDWVGESLAALKPVEAGRFIVYGAHDRARVPINRIAIEIEAALAFGTGHHGTTRGCLLALDRLCKSCSKGRNWNILDLGTGSGVLAIAAARALQQPVLASDIDLQAVRAARANARLNGAGAKLEVLHASGVNAQRLHAQAPFDLVFANILLRPLQRLAAPLTRLVAPHGRIVLSGFLAPQANAVIAAYPTFALEQRIELEGWATLVLTHRRRQPGAVADRHRGP